MAIIQCSVISHWIILRLSGWLAYLPSVKSNLQFVTGGILLLKCKSDQRIPLKTTARAANEVYDAHLCCLHQICILS